MNEKFDLGLIQNLSTAVLASERMLASTCPQIVKDNLNHIKSYLKECEKILFGSLHLLPDSETKCTARIRLTDERDQQVFGKLGDLHMQGHFERFDDSVVFTGMHGSFALEEIQYYKVHDCSEKSVNVSKRQV